MNKPKWVGDIIYISLGEKDQPETDLIRSLHTGQDNIKDTGKVVISGERDALLFAMG